MGAQPFVTRSAGKDAKSAFWDAVNDALHDYGHAGYTGTIGEKDSFIPINLPEGTDPYREANRMIDGDERVTDKWGPAGMFDLGEGHYLFFGWASY